LQLQESCQHNIVVMFPKAFTKLVDNIIVRENKLTLEITNMGIYTKDFTRVMKELANGATAVDLQGSVVVIKNCHFTPRSNRFFTVDDNSFALGVHALRYESKLRVSDICKIVVGISRTAIAHAISYIEFNREIPVPPTYKTTKEPVMLTLPPLPTTTPKINEHKAKLIESLKNTRETIMQTYTHLLEENDKQLKDVYKLPDTQTA